MKHHTYCLLCFIFYSSTFIEKLNGDHNHDRSIAFHYYWQRQCNYMYKYTYQQWVPNDPKTVTVYKLTELSFCDLVRKGYDEFVHAPDAILRAVHVLN